jgi:hypothetical protein
MRYSQGNGVSVVFFKACKGIDQGCREHAKRCEDDHKARRSGRVRDTPGAGPRPSIHARNGGLNEAKCGHGQ